MDILRFLIFITLITDAGKFDFEFKGGDKAHQACAYIMGQILGQAAPQLAGAHAVPNGVIDTERSEFN